MSTQSSSAPRLKFIKLGDEHLKLLYANCEVMDVVEYRKFCINLIISGSGGKKKKQVFVEKFENLIISKNELMRQTQNFILAGCGLGC